MLDEMESPPPTLGELKKTYLAKGEKPAVFISATNKENMDEFRKVLIKKFKKHHNQIFPNYLQNEQYY